MGVSCPSHNFNELELIHEDFATQCYLLDLSETVPDEQRGDYWNALFTFVFGALRDTSENLQFFERCLRLGVDMYSPDSVLLDDEASED